MRPSEFEDLFDNDMDDINEIEGKEDLKDAVLDTPLSAIMVRDPIVVEASATVVDAVNRMNERSTGCVLVERDGRLVGIFTERDILRRVIFHDDNRDWTVESVMTPRPETLHSSASIAFALNKMSVDGYRQIPIVSETGHAIGVVSIKDIVTFLVDFIPASVHNLPPDPEHAYGMTTDGG